MSIEDSPAEHPVISSRTKSSSPVFRIVEEKFQFRNETLTRAYAKHLSAVAVVALNDQSQIRMIRQYRHPVRSMLWEIPAGLLDTEGETMVEAAQRELHEEADLTAQRWTTLVDFFPTPGMSDEGARIYLAEGLTAVPHSEQYIREAEESEIIAQWVPLRDAVHAVLNGHVHNGVAVAGILALHATISSDARPRDTHAPWKQHPRGINP